MKPKHSLLYERLDKFLETQNLSDDGGWAIVKDGEKQELDFIFHEIIEHKYAEDVDGDLPIDFMTVDRNRERFILPWLSNYTSYTHKDVSSAFKSLMRAMQSIVEQIDMILRFDEYKIIKEEDNEK